MQVIRKTLRPLCPAGDRLRQKRLTVRFPWPSCSLFRKKNDVRGEEKEYKGTGKSHQPWENQDVEGQFRPELHWDQDREGQLPPGPR